MMRSKSGKSRKLPIYEMPRMTKCSLSLEAKMKNKCLYSHKYITTFFRLHQLFVEIYICHYCCIFFSNLLVYNFSFFHINYSYILQIK